MSTAPPGFTPPPAPFAQRYRRVLREGTWVGIGQAVSAAAGLVGTRLITRVISPGVFGIASLLMAGELLARSVFFAPVLNAGIRFYPDAERAGKLQTLRAFLGRIVARNLLILVPIFIVGAWIYLKHQPLRAAIACALGAFLIGDMVRSLEMAMLSGARRQARTAITSMIEAIARPLLILLGASLVGSTALAVIAGTAAAAAVAVVILRTQAARDRPNALPEQNVELSDTALTSSIRRFALPLIPVYLIIWVTSVSDRYIIQWFVRDTSAVGIYAAGYGLISQPFVLVNTVLSLTLRPIYWAAVSQRNGVHARRTFTIWTAAAIGICSAGVILSIVLRKPVVSLFLAPRYARTVEFVPWIAAGYFFYVLQQTLEQNLLAHKRTHAVLIEEAFGAIASVVATIPLVRTFGSMGAAYACPVYFGAQCALTAIFVGVQKRFRGK